MNYKGYYIDRNLLENLFTVFFNGDEIVFRTMKEAFEFIDEQVEALEDDRK